MKYITINYSELTDSREVLNNEIPSFILIFIFLIFFMIIGIFIWMWLGEAEDFVIAQGRVLPYKDSSIIRNTIGGYIKQINFKDGQYVKSGDLLYTIENVASIVQKDNIDALIKKLNEEISYLVDLENSIRGNNNLLSENASEFYYRFLVYQANYQRLSNNYQQFKEEYFNKKKLFPDCISEEELRKVETAYENSLKEFEALKLQTLATVQNELGNNRKQLLSLQNSLMGVEQDLSLTKVTAPIDGMVQIKQTVNPGEFIASEVEILKIVPTEETNYRMEIAVENRNVGLLEIGQNVKYDFQALPFQEYGFGNGEIVYITKDIIQDTDMIYRIEGTIIESQLINNRKEIGKIKPGMVCQARIIVRKKKIIFLVLEKLNLFFGKFGT
ncbi:MAG: HlyD family efflux transporter periplasmic adaptor subunit [Firmicutes bacterium]|nr:HlyD family efflux transporter periplasmic adaptor subunit [Bacillota bacterium]